MLDSTYEKHKHLIGSQIHKWKVLDILEHRGKDKSYIYAKCQCVCGTIRDIRLSKLLNNKCLDCGCKHNERQKEIARKKYEHLINASINRWTILGIIPPDEDRHGTFALCQCQCGTVKEVKLSYVINGRSKNCGCGRKEMLRETRTKSIVGQRFGKLVVQEMLERRNKYGRIVYRCKCDCGNVVDVLGNSLVLGHTSSCGCLLSYWNMYIQQFLEKNEIKYETEYTVYIDGNYYRYDFNLPEYNLFIEYDGQQHFKPIRFRGMKLEDVDENFKKNRERDKIKNRYCAENNINLLRIPYWEAEKIETIINNHLQRLSTKGSVKQSAEYATV